MHFFFFFFNIWNIILLENNKSSPLGLQRWCCMSDTPLLTFAQCTWTFLPFAGSSFRAASTQEWGSKLWRRSLRAVYVSVKGSKRKRQHGRVGDGQLIFHDRPLAWLRVDLSPKLNFHSLLPLLPPSASPCCPLPGTFVFTWPTSQGTRSYLWLSGLAAEYAAPVKFFHSDLAQHPNWTVQSFPVIPPQPLHDPILANNVKFHCYLQHKRACDRAALSFFPV